MWVLWLILVVLPPTTSEKVILETFESESACETVRTRLEQDMNAKYPTDRDFRIQCEYHHAVYAELAK